VQIVFDFLERIEGQKALSCSANVPESINAENNDPSAFSTLPFIVDPCPATKWGSLAFDIEILNMR